MSRPTIPGGAFGLGSQTLDAYIEEVITDTFASDAEVTAAVEAGKADIANAVTTKIVTVTAGPSTSGTTQSYTFGNVNNSVAFPVPGLRPSGTATQNIAFDIVPRGNPADNFSSGVAWLDVCNRDIVQFGNQPFNAAHLGCMENGDAVVSSTRFNGAVPGNVRLELHGVTHAQVNKTGGFLVGTGQPATVQGELALMKISNSATAPGAGFGKLALLPGTNAGTAKLVVYAGTSATPVTILDNIGSGVV